MSQILEWVFQKSQLFRSYPFCHSRPDRSFCYNGRYFGLCARCTTMYLGGILTILSSPIWSILSPQYAILLGAISLVPGGLDGTTQMFGDRESNNRLRAITGFLLGVGIVFISYGIVTLIKNIG